jgi:hypothetical protein
MINKYRLVRTLNRGSGCQPDVQSVAGELDGTLSLRRAFRLAGLTKRLSAGGVTACLLP